MNELMSKLGDQQAKYNFQGTIAFIIMKSLQRTAQTSARAPEDAAGCPSAALQFMLSRGCNYRLHYWISLWKSAIAPQIITPIHGGGLRSAQREWPRGSREDGVEEWGEAGGRGGVRGGLSGRQSLKHSFLVLDVGAANIKLRGGHRMLKDFTYDHRRAYCMYCTGCERIRVT